MDSKQEQMKNNPSKLKILFLQDLKKYGATTVVRVCEITYDKTPLEKDGITVMVRYISTSYYK